MTKTVASVLSETRARFLQYFHVLNRIRGS